MSDAVKVRELNDRFRKTMTGGQVIATRGILALPEMVTVLNRVREFDDFKPGNDPYGEHDFGAFAQGDRHIFWKIDLYEDDSVKDKNDPRAVRRILTIMLAEEY